MADWRDLLWEEAVLKEVPEAYRGKMEEGTLWTMIEKQCPSIMLRKAKPSFPAAAVPARGRYFASSLPNVGPKSVAEGGTRATLGPWIRQIYEHENGFFI